MSHLSFLSTPPSCRDLFFCSGQLPNTSGTMEMAVWGPGREQSAGSRDSVYEGFQAPSCIGINPVILQFYTRKFSSSHLPRCRQNLFVLLKTFHLHF